MAKSFYELSEKDILALDAAVVGNFSGGSRRGASIPHWNSHRVSMTESNEADAASWVWIAFGSPGGWLFQSSRGNRSPPRRGR